MNPIRLILSLLLASASLAASAADNWPEILNRMPLAKTNVTLLERGNCVPLLLRAFRSNDVVKALVFMPGATDEFYMFRRARATLTKASPTLWDAVQALTNQTFIRVTFHPPLLVMHTDEDPLEPLFVFDDTATTEKLKTTPFRKYAYYNDIDWDHLMPDLRRATHLTILPRTRTTDSWHFFRHCIAGWNLTDWEMLQAVALSGKETIRFETKRLVFGGDTRIRSRPKFEPARQE